VNGLRLAGVTRKDQDSVLAAYGRFAAVSRAANTFSQQGFLADPYFRFGNNMFPGSGLRSAERGATLGARGAMSEFV
jgi:hypothetical protein